jgi:hypothetical protein
MAFCNACGNQLTEGAQFCTSCGAPVAAPSAGSVAPASAASVPPAVGAPTGAQPANAPGKKRSPLVWIVPVIVVGLVALGAAGWFAFGLLSGGTATGRAKAQVETVAEFLQGYNEGDLERVQRVLPAEFADEVEAAFNSGADIGIDGEVTREWDGDVLVLTFVYADTDTPESLRLTADGGEQRGIVTLEQTGTDGYTYEAVVVREAGHWVLAEIDGVSVGDALAGTGSVDASDDEESGDEEYSDDSDDSSDDSADDDSSSDSSVDPTDQEMCFVNQRMIENAASEYFYAEGSNMYSDISGEIDDGSWLIAAGHLGYAPTCPYDDSYYWLYDDGTTGCPSDEHGYYLDEE